MSIGDEKQGVFTKLAEVGGKLKVKSALNPILWLCLFTTFPGLVLMLFVEFPIWVIILFFSPALIACLGFLILLFKDPDKLQSEEYQLQKRSMELMEEKGEAPKEIDVNNVVIIEDPLGEETE